MKLTEMKLRFRVRVNLKVSLVESNEPCKKQREVRSTQRVSGMMRKIPNWAKLYEKTAGILCLRTNDQLVKEKMIFFLEKEENVYFIIYIIFYSCNTQEA